MLTCPGNIASLNYKVIMISLFFKMETCRTNGNAYISYCIELQRDNFQHPKAID
jgi:hypothetical protein